MINQILLIILTVLSTISLQSCISSQKTYHSTFNDVKKDTIIQSFGISITSPIKDDTRINGLNSNHLKKDESRMEITALQCSATDRLIKTIEKMPRDKLNFSNIEHSLDSLLISNNINISKLEHIDKVLISMRLLMKDNNANMNYLIKQEQLKVKWKAKSYFIWPIGVIIFVLILIYSIREDKKLLKMFSFGGFILFLIGAIYNLPNYIIWKEICSYYAV